MWYGITFYAVQEFVMLWDSIIVFTISQKNEDILWHLPPIEYPQLYFCLGIIALSLHAPYCPQWCTLHSIYLLKVLLPKAIL